jgi:hypothetical protein
VGTRIYAAIAVTAALTVVATAVAFWSFAEVGRTMRQLVEDRFPVVEISLDLADAASAAVAIAPRLADAATLEDLDAQMDRLASGERRMRQQVANLPGTASDDKTRIAAQIDQLARDLNEAHQSARERLTQVAATRERVTALVNVQEQLTQLFVSMADDALFDLTLGMETAVCWRSGPATTACLRCANMNSTPRANSHKRWMQLSSPRLPCKTRSRAGWSARDPQPTRHRHKRAR